MKFKKLAITIIILNLISGCATAFSPKLNNVALFQNLTQEKQEVLAQCEAYWQNNYQDFENSKTIRNLSFIALAGPLGLVYVAGWAFLENPDLSHQEEAQEIINERYTYFVADCVKRDGLKNY